MEVAKETMAAEMAHIFLTDAQEMLPPASVESADYFAGLVARARAGDETAFERIMLATEQRAPPKIHVSACAFSGRSRVSEAAHFGVLSV
jgi:hypothetical protein